MSARGMAARISRRAKRAGVALSPDLANALEAYLSLLARWNSRINLTSLPIDPPNEEAIDRLLIEPLVAAREIDSADQLVLDVGSGGGSPALPLRLAVAGPRFVLVESKVRKSAFLREAVRQLGLERVDVVTDRLEQLLSRPDLHEAVDVLTIRAVKADKRLWQVVEGFVRPGGRVLWFGAPPAAGELDRPFNQIRQVSLGQSGGQLAVVRKDPVSPRR